MTPEQDGTLQAAVIYDPMRDELFTAERGQGARLNGKPMRVSKIPDLAEALISTGFPSRKRHASPNVHFYQEFTLRSHGVRRAARRRWTWRMWPAAGWRHFGSSA